MYQKAKMLRYELTGQVFDGKTHITRFVIRDHVTDEIFKKTSAELIHDKHFLKNCDPIDTMRIGFVAGMDTMKNVPL